MTYFLINFRHSTDREVSIMILMAYLSYMLAEVSSSSLGAELMFLALSDNTESF